MFYTGKKQKKILPMNKLMHLAAALVLLTVFSRLAPAAETPFLWQCENWGGGNFSVECVINDNAYLYADETRVVVENADGKQETLPKLSARIKDGAAIYTGRLKWHFSSASAIRITAFYQGCTVSGGEGDICLMPEEKVLWNRADTADENSSAILPETLEQVLDKFTLNGTLSGVPLAEELQSFITGQSPGSEKNTPAERTVPVRFWAMLALIVLGGLGLNLTPCVLPMIPINLAIIGADSARNGRFCGFRRGAAYGLGITLAYGTLGLLAALGGSQFGKLNSSSIFNWIIALIFAVLAAAMLGGYDLDLSRLGNLFRHGGQKSARSLPPEITAFGLGIVAALLAGACVAPVVISVIVLSVKLCSEGNYSGLLLPFALGAAMALPWPLLGAGMAILPKPGAWMIHVKRFFGIIIAAMAIYYGYLGWSLRSGYFNQATELHDLSAQLELASVQRQTVIVDFYASWCKNCPEVEKLLNQPSMQEVLKKSNIMLIKFRAEKLNDPAVKALMARYRLPGLPSLVRLTPEVQ